jgi:hypothetical protein
LPCTSAGWVPILDFYLQDFSSTQLEVLPAHLQLGLEPHRNVLILAIIDLMLLLQLEFVAHHHGTQLSSLQVPMICCRQSQIEGVRTGLNTTGDLESDIIDFI